MGPSVDVQQLVFSEGLTSEGDGVGDVDGECMESWRAGETHTSSVGSMGSPASSLN